MEEIRQTKTVKEILPYHKAKMYGNTIRNNRISEYYLRLLVSGIVKKQLLPDEITKIKKRMERLDGCNKFWTVETYETSHIKVLLRTFLCKDKFCCNCNQLKKLLLQKRFLPYLEKYKDSLYHMVLTVPNCSGKTLSNMIRKMTTSFKTLVTYLNGNKRIKGLDFSQYGYLGCLRSLEITYDGDNYHPHFHIAIVLNNEKSLQNKYIENEFSSHKNRLFSDFEITIQRIWWLLINGMRLTYENILGDNKHLERYSCILDIFHPTDYKKLFDYITKAYSENRVPMTYENFKVLYYALNRIRQIQGYGVFYNMKEPDMKTYTESEYQTLEDYLLCQEKPVISCESLSNLTGKQDYVILKRKYRL